MTALKSDRTVVMLATGVVWALFIITFSGPDFWAALSLGPAAVVVIAVLLRPAWLFFGLARLYFSVRGLLPWRLMRFLDDAHQRGMLRQSGSVYQFRHVELQRHLSRR